MLAIAGCYAPQPVAGVPCASPGAPQRCPAGLVCVDRGGVERCEVDVPPDAAPGDGAVDAAIDACAACNPTDSDGDGVDNVADNCPMVANAGQDNEDQDPLGDACDPCPISSTNSDADGDGVGNDCDPDNSRAHRIASFVGFGSGLPAGWTPIGNFTASGGDGVAVAAANDGAKLVTPSPSAGYVAVWAAVTFEAYAGSALVGVGVVDRHQPGTDDTLACQLVGTALGATEKLRLYDAAANMTLGEQDHALAPGATYELRLARAGASHTCSATNPTRNINGTSVVTPANPELGVRVRSGSARYHWIMVITEQP